MLCEPARFPEDDVPEDYKNEGYALSTDFTLMTPIGKSCAQLSAVIS